ncbi:thioredoxin family protein [Falsiporphyromonas endometrii]|uniref:Thioredoxin family protein n=1 Tax=Falsiporphyromonas endometrii TaxID=1387297 RepID=A0ABV9K5C9_9PORP
MKRNKAVLLVATLLMSTSMMFASCKNTKTVTEGTINTEVTTQNGPKKASKIVHLTAAQMIEKIYDYKANPNKWVYKGDKPAIIDFYADWCGPCKRLGPKLEKVAEKYDGQLTVYKINVDDEPELAQVFGVQSIPMVLFVPAKGTPIQTMGDLPEQDIENTIAKIIK